MTASVRAGAPVVDPLEQHTATWLLRWARAQLDAGNASAALGPPPAGVRYARPATVILTAFDGRSSAGFSGQGGTLLEAVMAAVGQAVAATPTPRRLTLDIVSDSAVLVAKPDKDGKLPNRAARSAWRRLTTWQDGLVVGTESDARWLVPTQLLLQGMARRDRATEATSPADVLAAAMKRLGHRATAWRDESVSLWQFRTSAWVEDAAYDQALPLIQGTIPAQHVTTETLYASARAGAEFLARSMRADGSFTYTHDPWLGSQSTSAYNVVRHAGTTSALYEVAAATGDSRVLQAAQQAMSHLYGWFRPSAQDGLTYVLDRDGKAKLGAFGLALLALSRKLEQAPEGGDRERALELGRQIVAMQQPDGSFNSYLPIKGNEPAGSVSLYYPGEAMLGLARITALGIDEGFLDAAHRGADFLIASRVGRTKLPPDAWLMQALDVLHATDPKPSYLEHTMAIARSMLADQYGPDAAPAYVGGFGNEPIRSTRTSARDEGLVSAVRLGLRVGDPRALEILADIQRTIPHLLPMQYDADNSFYLNDPAAVAGGMRGGLDDAEIRIDYVQHHISAMLGVASLFPPSGSGPGFS